MENEELIMFVASILGMLLMAVIVGGWQYKTSGKVSEALIKAIETFMGNTELVLQAEELYDKYVPANVDSLVDALVNLADGLTDGTVTEVDDRLIEAIDKITNSLPKAEA